MLLSATSRIRKREGRQCRFKTGGICGAGQTRRQVLKHASAALSGAALAMAPAVVRAQARAIKIGLVTPTTGPLAVFAESDAFVLAQFKKAIADGVKIG